METITEKIPEAKFMPKILGWWVVVHEILVTAQTSMFLDRVLVKENQKEGETETICLIWNQEIQKRGETETISEKIPEASFMPKILGWWVMAHEILVTAQASMCLDRVLVKKNQKE